MDSFEWFIEQCGAHGAQGKRPTMEDAHVCLDDISGFPPKNTGFFAVYDGHGGSYTSEKLAEVLHPRVLADPVIMSAQTTQDQLEKAWTKHYRDIDKQHFSTSRDGSTAVTALLHNNILQCANVGDSEGILYQMGKSNYIELTQVHNGSRNTEEVKRIEDGKGYVEKGYVMGILAVTRAFGDTVLKPLFLEQAPEKPLKDISSDPVIVDPYVVTVPLNIFEDSSSRVVLLLACDGLWDVMEHEDAKNIIEECKDYSAIRLAKHFVNTALQKRSNDNVSVVVAYLNRKEVEPRQAPPAMSPLPSPIAAHDVFSPSKFPDMSFERRLTRLQTTENIPVILLHKQAQISPNARLFTIIVGVVFALFVYSLRFNDY